MFIKELLHERNQLQLIQKHHLEKLNDLDNQAGVLLCSKHGNGFRWKRRYLQNGHVVTVDLHKTDKMLAEKLAVNLYRMISIEFLQKQMFSIDCLIRSMQTETKREKQFETKGEKNFEEETKVVPGNLLAELSLHELLYKVRNYPRVPADFFDSQSPYRALIISHLEKEYAWIIDWYLGDFRQNPDHLEFRVHPVKLGYKVRSKSEVMEADRLLEEGILFHYEELIPHADDNSYSDFYIPVTIVEKYVWEHFGAMDKDKYFFRAKGKINEYLDQQWLPGINMITTYETKQYPMTEEKVDQMIRWLKGRYRIAFPDLPPDESFNLYDLAAIVKCRRSKS